MPLQVPEGPFDIEQVMESIRTQIVEPVERKPAMPSAVTEVAAAQPASALISDGTPLARVAARLELLRQRQWLDPGYSIRSHRPLIGRLLDAVKRVIHWGARPYTDAVRARQEAFNESTWLTLSEIASELEQRANQLAKQSERLTAVEARVDEQRRRLAEQTERLIRHERSIAAWRAEATHDLERLDGAVQGIVGRHDVTPFFAAIPAEKRLAAMNNTRGVEDEIMLRQRHYVGLFAGAPGQVLDLGCGRGELLNMLRIEGHECWGVDVDPLMVEATRRKDVHVLQKDALSALRDVKPASLGGIFAAQLVEHLFPGELLELLRLAHERLAPGGRIILETLNPASLAVLAKSYYRDLEHKQPVHPDYLKLLLELAGFEDVELSYLAPFNEAERLSDLPPAQSLGLNCETRDALQAQTDHLNRLLYGMQDYYVTGRRA